MSALCYVHTFYIGGTLSLYCWFYSAHNFFLAMFTPTITKSDLLHCDLLFYRPRTLFGRAIGLFEAIANRKFDRLAFSHVATVINGRRFDAMEWYRTGFRDTFDNAYVFRFKNLTDEQENEITKYCLKREHSLYDRRGILAFLFPKVAREDEFRDYCSEMMKNALFAAGIIEDVERVSPYELYKLIREKVDFVGIII